MRLVSGLTALCLSLGSASAASSEEIVRTVWIVVENASWRTARTIEPSACKADKLGKTFIATVEVTIGDETRKIQEFGAGGKDESCEDIIKRALTTTLKEHELNPTKK